MDDWDEWRERERERVRELCTLGITWWWIYIYIYIYIYMCVCVCVYIYIYIYTFLYKIKRKCPLLWCHYEFISGRDDHHEMYKKKFIWMFLYCLCLTTLLDSQSLYLQLPSLHFEPPTMANASTRNVTLIQKFFEHRINPTLYNVEALISSKISGDGS